MVEEEDVRNDVGYTEIRKRNTKGQKKVISHLKTQITNLNVKLPLLVKSRNSFLLVHSFQM